MSDKNLNILINLNDQLSASLNTIQKNLDEFSKQAKTVGRDIKEIGQTFALTGAAITGPFALALNAASKSSVELNNEFRKLNNVGNQLQSEVSNALLPSIQSFTEVIENLYSAFESIPKSIKESAIQGVVFTGVMITLGGVLSVLIGKVVILISNISKLSAAFLALEIAQQRMILANIAIGLGISLIIAAMIKWKGVADTIVSTFEVMFRFFMNGVHTIEVLFGKLVENVLKGLLLIVDGLAKIPGPTQSAFKAMADQIKQTADVAHEFASIELQNIAENTKNIGEILKTGEGEWSQTFENLKSGVTDFVDHIINGNSQIKEDTSALNAELVRMEDDLRLLRQQNSSQDFLVSKQQLQEQIDLQRFFQQEVMISMQGIASLSVSIGKSLQQNLSVAFSDIILRTKSAKEAFAELGRTLVKAVVDFMVQKGVAFALEKTMTALHIAISSTAAAATAAAWAPAAAMVSLASFGGNAAPASAGIASTAALAQALAVPRAFGGDDIITKPTLFLAGERGPERATFSPVGSKGFDGGGSTIQIFIDSPRINSTMDITKLAEELGFEIERKTRSARGF